jgi:hypothetical protein
MVLESTRPLTEMSTRNLPRGKGRPVRKTKKFTAICVPTVLAPTSHNPMGIRGLLSDFINNFIILILNYNPKFPLAPPI